MSGADFLRLEKLTGSGIIKAAARHNRRVIQAELGAAGRIDPARSHLNETLVGPPTADDVALLARNLMAAAGIDKPRKNMVRGIEIVFSLEAGHHLDERQFFSDCVLWAGHHFGGAQNILSADIHRDEAAPHCHVLILPMLNGRMVGSDMVGGRTKLRDTRQRFHDAVGAPHGLAKAPPRLLGATKAAAIAKVLERLRAGSDGALKSRVWCQVKDSINRDPGPFLLALGIKVEPAPKKLRTVAQIFTSRGRGSAREEKPIGFASRAGTPSLCSVGFAAGAVMPGAWQLAAATAPATATEHESHKRAQEAAPAALPGTEHHQALDRVREDEIDAGLFDPETGEFFERPGEANLSASKQTRHWEPEDWHPDDTWQTPA